MKLLSLYRIKIFHGTDSVASFWMSMPLITFEVGRITVHFDPINSLSSVYFIGYDVYLDILFSSDDQTE